MRTPLRTRAEIAWHHFLGSTVCRVLGHRHSQYVFGLCDRCYSFMRLTFHGRHDIRVARDGWLRR